MILASRVRVERSHVFEGRRYTYIIGLQITLREISLEVGKKWFESAAATAAPVKIPRKKILYIWLLPVLKSSKFSANNAMQKHESLLSNLKLEAICCTP